MNKVKQRVYLSPPHMSGRERKYINEVFDTNWIAPLGPQVDAFEDELAAYLGVKEVAVLTSGTAALHLSLLLLDVGRGDRVFCSSLTFAATANPILYLGAEPVFIDSEPESWNMSKDALKRALSDAEQEGALPKAVIVVNLYGQSADLELINAMCSEFGIPVLEDAAESLGATYRGKMSGSLGMLGILSFNGNKIITTSGGGALVSDETALIEKARYLATQARQPARHYEHTEVGYNYRMSNVLAGIGRGQLEVLEERVAAKRAVFEGYFEALRGVEGFEFMPEADFGRATRWLTVLTVDPDQCGASRDDLIDAMEAENIEARPVWKPMHLQPLYSGCRYYPHFVDKRGSVSDRLFELGLCLPSGSNLSIEDQARVIDCIKRSLQQGGCNK